MIDASWFYESVDSRGFVAFADLRRRALSMTREQFVRDLPVPALLVVHRQPESVQSEPLDPSHEGMQLLTTSTESQAILLYLNRLAFICKRPGNPFAHLISIGRSVSNDIVVAVDSVSKVHGYFARDGESYTFTDHSSTNGSLLNDRPVEPGRKNRLRDKDILQIGVEVTLEYFSPGRLFDQATRGR